MLRPMVGPTERTARIGHPCREQLGLRGSEPQVRKPLRCRATSARCIDDKVGRDLLDALITGPADAQACHSVPDVVPKTLESNALKGRHVRQRSHPLGNLYSRSGRLMDRKIRLLSYRLRQPPP